MAVQEVEVGSLGELVDRVTPGSPDPVTDRRRYTGVFHGSSNAAFPLLTSLDRLGGVTPAHTKAGLEEHILRSFIRYSRPYLPTGPANDWELLAIAQHHGVPTRLLDWSYSPLIAAHFATRSREQEGNRVVWRLDWKRVHQKFDFPELALLIGDLDRYVGRGQPFTPWTLIANRPDLRDFACMIEPPAINPRVVAQSAVFTLCSDSRISFDAFLDAHGLSDALTRYVIPASRCDLFRDQLDLVGMDERRLFPDLDGVAAELNRYYS